MNNEEVLGKVVDKVQHKINKMFQRHGSLTFGKHAERLHVVGIMSAIVSIVLCYRLTLITYRTLLSQSSLMSISIAYIQGLYEIYRHT